MNQKITPEETLLDIALLRSYCHQYLEAIRRMNAPEHVVLQNGSVIRAFLNTVKMWEEHGGRPE